MKLFSGALNRRPVEPGNRWAGSADLLFPHFDKRGIRLPCKSHAAFTLIELILILALLVIITSLAAPAMSGFIRGRALDSESRRLLALMHAGQNRAVSEGLPMDLWVDTKQNTYGLSAETTGSNGDPKTETLTADSGLQITVLTTGVLAPTTFHNLPAIRFLPDGSVDENSPPILQLTDSSGASRWLVELPTRLGYEISDTKP